METCCEQKGIISEYIQKHAIIYYFQSLKTMSEVEEISIVNDISKMIFDIINEIVNSSSESTQKPIRR